METVVSLVDLQRAKFTTTDNAVEVQLGWGSKGSFPKPDFDLAQAWEGLGLFYMADNNQRELVAVDRLYRTKDGGFEGARLLGLETEIPPIRNNTSVRLYISTTPVRQRIEVVVVRHEDELLFQVSDVIFDSLWAFPEFEQGELSIYRDSKLFDQTEYIHEVGTHAAQTVFSGLNNLIGEKYHGMAAALNPKDFQEGDKLVLEVPVRPGWNLANHIRLMGGMNTAVHAAFSEKQEWNMGDLNQRIGAELAEKAAELKTTQIVRFRQ